MHQTLPLGIPIDIDGSKPWRQPKRRRLWCSRIIDLLDRRQLTKWIQGSSKRIKDTKRLIQGRWRKIRLEYLIRQFMQVESRPNIKKCCQRYRTTNRYPVLAVEQ